MSNIDKKTFRRCLLVFLILAFIIYGKSIRNDYAMDDEFVIHNNQQVHGGIKAIPNIFRTTYAIGPKASYEYRPLVKATYALEYQFFGENPHVSHFLNILLYVLLVTFLFYLLLRLLHNYHYIFSFAIALLFLLHPLHSEVVMSIKNRDVLLSFLGCLLSLFFYLRYADNKKTYNIIFGSFFLLFAIMSKKDSITFMAVIPFSMWFFKESGWKKMGIVIASYLPAMLTFRLASSHLTNAKVRTVLEWENPLFQHTTMLHRIPQGFYSLYFYLKMFILPYPLVSYYGFNQVPLVGWENPVVWIVILLLIVVGYFVVKNFKSKPIWLYGVLYFIITISMFLNTVEPVVGIVGERFEFIPSLGLCIVAIYFILKYLKVPIENKEFKIGSFSSKLWPVAAVIALLFGGEVFARNAAWKNAYILYKTDTENAPESAHIHSLLSASAIQKVQTEQHLSREQKHQLVLEAEEHYKEALRIIPNYISAHNNLGMVYYTYMSAPDKAIPELTRAVQLDTNYVEAYYNLASCYAAIKQYDQAEKLYFKTIKLDPKFTSSYLALSNMYAMNKEFDKILRVNQRAIDKGIQSDVMYVNIGNVYFMNGDTLKALPYLEKAIEFNANNRNLNAFLANYYQAKGNSQKAAYYYDLASRSTPR